MDHMEFDRLISAAFLGGERKSRELRLADHYPATVEPLGGQWYQVTFI